MSIVRIPICRSVIASRWCRLATVVAVVSAIVPVSPATAEEQKLRTTVVTATRSEAVLEDLPVTVTTITREEVDRRLPLDEADLFRDDPDIVMTRDLRRHGATRVNIRGIEDNRVVQMIDGVRLPDYFFGGGPTNFNRSSVGSTFPDFLKRVEIVRGPASSLYGSDAMGGVVGYITLDPDDVVCGNDTSGLRLRGGYFGANDQFSGSVVGALRGANTEFLIGYGEARGHETENRGGWGGTSPLREKANPADSDDRSLLAKLIARPAAGHQLSATVEGRKQTVDSDIRRLSGSLARVIRMSGDDEGKRTRFSLEYEHKPASVFYDRLLARVYYQDAETYNQHYNRRSLTNAGCSAQNAGIYDCDVYQDFLFEQKTTGANFQFESSLGGGDVTHLFTYGLDLMRVDVETKRDATLYNLGTGTVLKAVAGESYPLRDFPNGRTDTIGLFLQDETVGLFGGRLTLTPGIRYDHARLEPDVDALAQPMLTLTNSTATSESYSRLSPKLGAQWRFSERVSAWGQLASGFRAPNYQEVNGAFHNAGVPPGYSIIPNPDIKPETSVGIELGLRGSSATAHAQVSAFYNRYEDFIEQMTLAQCPNAAIPQCMPSYIGRPGWQAIIGLFGDARTYQYQNLAQVRIYGLEFRGSWNFAPAWRFDGAIAYANGTDTDRDEPLNSVEPVRASLGLGYATSSWGAEARVRAAARKTRIDDSAGRYFRPPSYAVIDFATWISPSSNTRVTLGINNVLDKKYWLWGDIRQAEATYPDAVGFYSQPGRNVRIAFQADF